MKVVYAKQEFPDSWSFSIFLAGPTPRDQDVPSWRPDALAWLEKHAAEMGLSDMVVFVPEDEEGEFQGSYIDQVEWESKGLNFADVILFWVPRDLEWLPGFTTNVEFGKWCSSAKAVLGHPKDAPKTRYLDWLANDNGMPVPDHTLEDTCKTALEQHPGVDVDTRREGGERYVPLLIWQTPMFQDWYAAHKKCGNRLDEAEVRWVFHMPKLGKVFSWVLWVKVWINAEQRYKENEFVLSRMDIAAALLTHNPIRGRSVRSLTLQEVLGFEVVLVKEFRSPVRTSDGFIHELPGGSSATKSDPKNVVRGEVYEEAGLPLALDRFIPLGSRQVTGTLSSHHAALFLVHLEEHEMDQARNLAAKGTTFGVVDDTERTYVEVKTVEDLLEQDLVDWTTLGMLFKGLWSLPCRRIMPTSMPPN